MSLQPCKTKSGKPGTKYGAKGKCYPGKTGKVKAIKQAIAIAHSQGKKAHL